MKFQAWDRDRSMGSSHKRTKALWHLSSIIISYPLGQIRELVSFQTKMHSGCIRSISYKNQQAKEQPWDHWKYRNSSAGDGLDGSPLKWSTTNQGSKNIWENWKPETFLRCKPWLCGALSTLLSSQTCDAWAHLPVALSFPLSHSLSPCLLPELNN